MAPPAACAYFCCSCRRLRGRLQSQLGRFTVYWNCSNPRFHTGAGDDRGGCTVEVSISDYLDIYCLRYGAPLPPAEPMDHYVLHMVNGEGHASCDHRQRGFERWECNFPTAPGGCSSSPRSSSSSRPSRWTSSSAPATSITTSLPHHQCC